MNERQPPLSYEVFLDEIHPATIAAMEVTEYEVTSEYEFLSFAEDWLEEHRDDPSTDPNQRLGYEQAVQQIKTKLEQPYGQA